MKLAPTSFQTNKAQVNLSYKITGDKKVIQHKNELLLPEQPYRNQYLQVSSKVAPHTDGKGGYILSLSIKALQPLELVNFETTFMTDLKDQRMMANGFQSWSQAREFTKNDRIPAIRSSVAKYTQLNLQGDYDIFQHSGDKGLIHSSSYTHFRDLNNVVSFFGSVSENLGYTYFKGDFNNNTFSIYKDVVGKKMTEGQEIEFVRVFMAQGIHAEAAIWDSYAEFYEDRRAIKNNEDAKRHVNGWTSWYNYYGDVSESIVYENVEALQSYQYPINIFQIDDGFQTAIGDWLSINQKFPSGMKAVADKIKGAGFKAGLWLAPYAVGFNSQVAKEHPDWLIIDPETNKPVVAGPNWGGFYALDMYHVDARKYLKNVFDIVLQDWGFDMLKLDFCFAAAMIPRMGKSRGEIMWEAMELIRDFVGPDKLVLGCGVPLASAFRKVDYCRIGSDVAPWWEDSKLKLLHVRERVSTANSLVSTLTRWVMSDRMFGNDPDVMILRKQKNKLTEDERYTLCVLNNILGALVFISDNVRLYGRDEHLLYSATFPKVIAHVYSVLESRTNCFVVNYLVNDKHGRQRRYTTFANLAEEEQTIYLPESSHDTHLLFATDNDMHMSQADESEALFYHPSSAAKLKVHETKTFMHIPLVSDKSDLIFLGSTSHIVPGAELDEFSVEKKDIKITFREENKRRHRVLIGYGPFLHESRQVIPPECTINGKQARHEWIPVSGSGEGRKKSEVLALVLEEF
ncbi:glycoside hydrolase superfamily [Gilbertella persicaria]|uniref:glycoside hydrolase superfamily n=1 Tax=Gilbertella persicaria TaxID=101096 RepID=UPI00221FA24E|nr:glycoside hydrolase superfamily [Gilbertella persicaria]KAI8077967.1 glycoside hydrolase superfamily [Gilbertella persicaria]